MKRGHLTFGNVANPLIVVQWIIAVSTIIGGVYVISPFLKLSISLYGKSVFLQTVGSNYGLLAFGCLFIFSGVLIIVGIIKRKASYRSAGLFLNGLCRLYVIIANILAVGVLPLSWLSNAVIMLIVFFIWSRLRKRGVE